MRLSHAPICLNFARKATPPDVMSLATARGEPSWVPNQVMSLASLSMCNLWIEWVSKHLDVLPQHRSPNHDQERPVSPHQWVKTTNNVSHHDQHQRAYLDLFTLFRPHTWGRLWMYFVNHLDQNCWRALAELSSQTQALRIRRGLLRGPTAKVTTVPK